MDMPTPKMTARVRKKEAAFSLPSLLSSHTSNLEGSSSSASPSSGKFRGVHQRLHAVDHGGEEVDGASDQGQPKWDAGP